MSEIWRRIQGREELGGLGFFHPKTRKNISGYHNYPLIGINLRYMYLSPKNSGYIGMYQYEQQNVVLIFIIFISFDFINPGPRLRYMYRLKYPYSERACFRA